MDVPKGKRCQDHYDKIQSRSFNSVFLQPNSLRTKPLAYCSGTAGSLGHYHKSQLLPRFCLLRNLTEPAIIVQLDNRD